ncbi:hypothetical protein VVR85_06390 [Corynebacterium sp. LK2590]|uniref:hypothetical protein n=1 Tax=unclassified Corynebacterium TaxID=2624378 RepID=UPI0034CFD718
MGYMTMGPGEAKRVDVTAPFRTLVFPLLELILITGVCWIAIGWLDAQGADLRLRNALVVLWGALSVWRFVLPVIRSRRKRFIVTDRRVIARAARLGGRTDSIPLRDIVGARRRRGGISLAIRGYDQTLYFPDVPKTKKVEAAIGDQLRALRSPIWR